MRLALFDSHCHLDAPEFDGDRDAVIERAELAGIGGQLVPAIDYAGWPKLKAVCAARPGLYPAYGLHPMFVDRHLPEHLAALPAWIERERPRAVGECGLDFFLEGLDAQEQRRYFRGQLQMARDFALPVVVHARRSVEEVIASLRALPGLRGVIHSYSGSDEQARQLFDLGFCLGIGGPVTYERARRLRRIVSAAPLENLLLETDAPDQPDALHRGQRNEPARLLTVLETIASLRDADAASIAAATRDNARRLFAISD